MPIARVYSGSVVFALYVWRMQTLADTSVQTFLRALLGGKFVQASGQIQ